MKSSDSLYSRDPDDIHKYIFPDTLTFDKEPFATVIPYRTPSFKVHRTQGLANSALTHHKQGAKYELIDGVWHKCWEFKDPEDCDSCGIGLDPSRDRFRNYYGNQTGWLRSPLHKGSAIDQPYLCLNCYEAEVTVVEDKKKARDFAAEQKRRKIFDAKQ